MGHSTFLRDFAVADGAPPTARQLYQTFEFLLYDFAYDQEFEAARYRLADFTERWGRLSVDALLEIARRFAPGQPRSEVDKAGRDDMAYYGPHTSEANDTCFALAALGVLRTPETPDVLLPYLASPYAIERWLAALGLVTMRDERVLPAIKRMLTEFVGPYQPRTPQGGSPQNFQLWRHRLLRLLADWGDPRVVPPIRAGLIATVRAEELEVPEPHGPEQEFTWFEDRFTGSEAWSWFYAERMFWVNEEHPFVYTLGQLGAFEALEGVPIRSGVYNWIPSSSDEVKGGYLFERRAPGAYADGFRANIWRVHLCFGALEARFRGQFLGQTRTVFDFADAPELAEAVGQLLADKFGMDEAARRQAMEAYDEADYVYATVLDYRRFAERAQVSEEDGPESWEPDVHPESSL